MKAIVFTLDALFSLIIAGAGISVLLYFHFSSQIPYIFKYNQASSLLQQLSSTPVSVLIGNGNASWVSLSSGGANESWDQFLNNSANNAGNPAGPTRQYVSFIYSLPAGSTVTNGTVVADYGMLYFATGSNVYAVNPYSGNTVWTATAPPGVLSDALYQGRLIVVNSMSISALNAYNGNLVWTANLIGSGTASPTTPITVYKNEGMLGIAVQGTGAHDIESFNLGNGTVSWTYADQTPVKELAVANGSVVEYNGYSLNLLTDADNTNGQALIWSLPVAVGSDIATYANDIAFGTGGSAEIVSINGTVAATKALGPTVYGVSSYNGTFLFQDTYNISAFSLNGVIEWKSIGGSYSAPVKSLANATPVSSFSSVYSVWGSPGSAESINVKNANTGQTLYSAYEPYAGHQNPYIALAYGKLFVPVSNYLIAIGTCSVNPSQTALAAIATMRINNMYGCSDYVLDQVSQNTNVSFFVGNPAGPIPVAQFNGADSYGTLSQVNAETGTNSISYTVWFRLFSLHGNPTVFGDTMGSPRNGYDLYVSSSSNDIVAERFAGGSGVRASDANAIRTNEWYFAAVTYNSTSKTLELYVNGSLAGSKLFNAKIAPDSPQELAALAGSGLGDEQIAGFQAYNSTLSQSQVAALYQEGIGGLPLASPRPIAWYPLAGDMNSYGTNASYSGYPNNVMYGSISYVPQSLNNSIGVSTSSVTLPLYNYSSGKYGVYNVGVYAWR